MPCMILPPTKRGIKGIFLAVVALSCAYLVLFMHRGHAAEDPLMLNVLEGTGAGHGGRWYIPTSWDRVHNNGSHCATKLRSITDAAECGLKLALENNAFIEHSRIPLITHQTWRSLATETWSELIRNCVKQWIVFAKGHVTSDQTETAWFLWDDEGIDAFMSKYEAELYPSFSLLPYPVEKSDVFRVLVLKWFGGVYGDIDTRPLTNPHSWILDGDVDAWTDTVGGVHGLGDSQAIVIPDTAPATYAAVLDINRTSESRNRTAVNAIFGLEADNLPDPHNTYWRMGYTYPVQLTNWAFAMAPHQPVATQYISNLVAFIEASKNNLKSIDPLDITGPPALTRAVQEVVVEQNPDFNWQSLSARNGDPVGGRGKVVAGDTLVLPITGFNPGRGWYQNMGSQSLSHPNARLKHAAAGSWRKPDMKVVYGKFCRTAFGMCRDWKKIADP